MIKPLAIYFPAFQRTPENDEWWGEGFTEWDNVRTAKRYFSGQQQPLVPLHEHYYDLSNPADVERQVNMALQYGLGGFIFYHYWFNSHKQMFERPAEIMRDQIHTNLPYCFCWANQTWRATWHGEKMRVLIPQEYGHENEWLEHIRYLESFFKDPKYLRIDDRPVLFIYNASEIPCYNQMIHCWNKYLATKDEQSVYIVEFISSMNRKLCSPISDAVTEFEPLYTTFFDIPFWNKTKRACCKILKKMDYQNYDDLWHRIIRRQRTYSGKPIFKGGFVAWDNSPRKEKHAMIVRGSSPQKFGKYVRELIETPRQDARNDYFVINAWNEWSEGPILEPTEQNGFGYLEALRDGTYQR
jgi:hypothetical protein